MSVSEPPPPRRGQTAQERSSDATPAEVKAAEQTSMFKRACATATPRFVLGQADGYPIVIKQFLQFCLILIYPAWLFAVFAGLAVYAVLWVVFAPLRVWMKRKDPEAYAASQQK